MGTPSPHDPLLGVSPTVPVGGAPGRRQAIFKDPPTAQAAGVDEEI
jgi:hypothetical protein